MGRSGLNRWRHRKDRALQHLIALGGWAVIGSVLLILWYLLWEVFPLFLPASIESRQQTPVAAEALWLDFDEQETVLSVLDRAGSVSFVDLGGGPAPAAPARLPGAVSTLAADAAGSARIAAGLGPGVTIFEVDYRVEYQDDRRVVSPRVTYPYGPDPLAGTGQGVVQHLAYADDDRRLTLALTRGDGGIEVHRLDKRTNFLTGDVSLAPSSHRADAAGMPAALALSGDQRWLYVALPGGILQFYELAGGGAPRLISQQQVMGAEITAMAMLVGGVSVLIGDAEGEIAQFFPVRDSQNRYRIEKIRRFEPLAAAVERLLRESRRKGFVAIDASGGVALINATARRTVLSGSLADGPPQAAALSPRANALALSRDGLTRVWGLHNEHPEVSWPALWNEVWYENYPEPALVWQSSAANSDFEPKFSLTPLAFGTLKAAFYAMLFAVPLALAGALYTAQFMAPGMRRTVKPTIEIMEALPTVILGFLAGLWLAPVVEGNLAGVFALLLVVPPGIVLFAWAWHRLPLAGRARLPAGWEPALLVPVVVALGWLGLVLGAPLEALLFGGDMKTWMRDELDVDYDQRNALVVGLAMGFAVIPTVFSIAEDALFGVPKSLSQGSLALGATPWQTVVRVVLPTASPGIFSGIMIGLGRAVGETMIVLMATGNTPIMDFNIFEGMRTLSANIAVEMPEAEVGSTHYRVLFAAALVLFAFTFVFNTAAEIVRQRLREKYASL